jgi:Mrp family chromosome partitioning ATPase
MAVEPDRASSPNVKRILALGLVVGLCVGLAVTIVAQTLDSRIRRVQEIRQLADVPLLATLPKLRRSERRGLVVRDKPSSEVGEAFRALRTNISFLESKDRRSLLITAVANESDGALVPANLAWTLAQTGQRILLVDLDLRRSASATCLVWPPVPASRTCSRSAPAARRDRPTDHPCLSVVLSGAAQRVRRAAQPAELASAVDWMERHYDHVIVHAPPLLSYTDATVVSAAVGGTLVTVAAGSTQASS